MRYINPKTDFAFKKIFGSTGSQGILRSFLNAVLYEGAPRIVSLEIVDPYSIPRLEGMKDSYLDVRAVLDDGQHVIIEMQVLNIPGMEKRVLYNAAKEYSNQLIKGQDYRLLNPVIALTLTDFIMFPDLEDQVISRFALMEKNKLIAYPEGDVELVFVELPKFHTGLEELRTLTDKWLYFVASAAELESVPPKLSAVGEIGDAFEIAEMARLTPDEDHRLEQKLRWIADQKMILAAKLDAEAKLTDAEAKLTDAEAKLTDAEVKLTDAEAKIIDAVTKAKEADTNSQEADAKAREADAKAREIQHHALAALVGAGMTEAEARQRLKLE